MREFVIALSLLVLQGCDAAATNMPARGTIAPDFRLQDQNNDWHSLATYQGKWIAMFFYPAADTPGCTKEACAFRDDIYEFKRRGVVLLGVSLDPVSSQKAFAEKYSLPFPLLSDARQTTARAYGVLSKAGFRRYARRVTFLIDPDGEIAQTYELVKPEEHSAEVLADLEKLMKRKPGRAMRASGGSAGG